MPIPDREGIKRIAHRAGYYERTAEKSNTLFFQQHADSAEDPNYPNLINVFYTTRGVMTKINHPKGGYNELWRSDAYDGMNSLRSIFENPRIHTGRGYRNADEALRGCAECGLEKMRFDYSNKQWKKGTDLSKCKECSARAQQTSSVTMGTASSLRKCAKCCLEKERSEYSGNQWRKGPGASNCNTCVEQKENIINRSGSRASEESKMHEEPPIFQLLESMCRIDPEQCKAFRGRWTDLDVDQFRETLAEALAEHRHDRYDGGYSWLVDTPEKYSMRIGTCVAQHEMPKAPTQPVIDPDPTDEILRSELTEHKAYCGWNGAALAALRQRFPDCLEHFLDCPAIKPRLNNPPIPLYTIREAIEYVAQVAEGNFFIFEEMQLQLQNVLYTPSANGPDLFLQGISAYKQDLDMYGYGTEYEISYWRLTLYCMMAFRKSGLPETKVVEIERAWYMETYPPEGPELYKAFIDFVRPKIMELEAIHFSELSKEPIAELKHQNATQTTAEWRQWKFWCFTCGCNLTHNSDKCSHPNRHHKIAATYDHKLGGNSKKDHLRLKWCHPYTNRPYEKPFDIPNRKSQSHVEDNPARRGCAECGLEKERSEYSGNQWRKGPGASNCSICMQQEQKSSPAARKGNAKPFIHRTGIAVAQVQTTSNCWLRLVSSIQCDAEGCNRTPTIRCERCQMAYYCSYNCQRSHHDHCRQVIESELTSINEDELRVMAMASQWSGDRSFHALMIQAEYMYEANQNWGLAVQYYSLAAHTDEAKNSIQNQAKLAKGTCRCCYELNEYDRAIDFGKIAIGLNRHLQQVHYYVAKSLLATGKRQEAKTMMERAILYEASHDEANKRANQQFLSQIIGN